jgi:hypothetical protein
MKQTIVLMILLLTNQLFKELDESLDSKYPSYIKLEKDFKGQETLHYLRDPDIGEIHLFRDYVQDNPHYL